MQFGDTTVNACAPATNALHDHSSIEMVVPAGTGNTSRTTGQAMRLEVWVSGQRLACGTMDDPASADFGSSFCTPPPVLFQYASPVIDSIDPPAITTIGQRIAIHGANFGSGNASIPVAVRIGGKLCTDVVVLSDEELTCIAPEGSGLSPSLLVQVDGVTSQLQAPSDAAAGSLVWPIVYLSPNVTSVQLLVVNDSSSAQEVLSVQSALPLTPVSGGNGSLLLVHGMNLGSATAPGSCVRVVWSSVAQAADSTETAVSAVCSNPAVHDPLVGELPPRYLLARNHSTWVVQVPQGLGTCDVHIVVDGQVFSLLRALRYVPPVIEDMHPRSCGTSGGVPITITGRSLGFTPLPSYAHVRVNFFDSEHCASNASLSLGVPPLFTQACSSVLLQHTHSTISFLALPGIGKDLPVTVTVYDGPDSDVLSSNTMLFSYEVPVITGLSPSPLLVDGSALQKLRVFGQNFGSYVDSVSGRWTAAQSEVRIQVQEELCGNAGRSKGEDGVLECDLQPLIVGHKRVNITVAGQGNSNDSIVVNGGGVMSRRDYLLVACAPSYYGQVGEVCLKCPVGATCGGYNSSSQAHQEPVSLPSWYSMNATGEDCPVERRTTRPYCPNVVPCQPNEACIGDNHCAMGYKSVAPVLRCATCDDCYRVTPSSECQRFYRRSGECVKCPQLAWMLIVAFLVMALLACGVGYVLNKKRVNLAFVSIGVDYFQVIAMFSSSKVRWPEFLKALFAYMSFFNFNIDVTAPECSVSMCSLPPL